MKFELLLLLNEEEEDEDGDADDTNGTMELIMADDRIVMWSNNNLRLNLRLVLIWGHVLAGRQVLLSFLCNNKGDEEEDNLLRQESLESSFESSMFEMSGRRMMMMRMLLKEVSAALTCCNPPHNNDDFNWIMIKRKRWGASDDQVMRTEMILNLKTTFGEKGSLLTLLPFLSPPELRFTFSEWIKMKRRATVTSDQRWNFHLREERPRIQVGKKGGS